MAFISLFVFTTVSVTAQTTEPQPTTITEKKEQEKTPVKVEELPEAVKNAIAGSDYKGWTVKTAYVLKGVKDIYEITFVKGQEITTANFSKDGKKLI